MLLRLDPARTKLISGFVDTYLRLNQQEERAFQEELGKIEPSQREGIMQIVTSWMEQGIEQGIEQGANREKKLPKSITLTQAPEAMESMINEMVDTYEASYKDHWHSLSQGYRDGTMHNIVGFEMIVNRLEGKYKLSQNRSQLDQKTVSDSLIENSDPMIRNVGLEMKRNFESD
jgi:hypothetical protein